MQHNTYHSVTSMLPILVPSSLVLWKKGWEKGKLEPGEAYDGLANFDAQHSFRKLLLATTADLYANIKRCLNSHELLVFRACLELKQAHEKKDQLALQRAYEDLWPVISGKNLWPSSVMAGIVGGPLNDEIVPLDQTEIKKTFSAIAKEASSDQRWHQHYLPPLVTKEMDNARFVLWWSHKHREFMPAVYCPTLKAAVFYLGFIGEIRSCARCRKLFVPKNSNVDYCSPAHGDAHRVARWRAQKKSTKRTPTTKRGKSKGAAR